MNYVFFGTPQFAAIILEKLIEAKIPPALVVCNPDRPVGRKKIITKPPIKLIAEKQNIPVFQPESLGLKPFTLHLSKIRPDFAVVAAYAKILPKEIIDAFPKGLVGVHPSLLPKYRGSTPIQSAILAGEETTGTALFLLDEKMDHGAILAQRELDAYNLYNGYKIYNNYSELARKLAELSADLLIETLPKFAKGEIKPQPQNHNEATFTKKFKTEDGFVDNVALRQAQGLEENNTSRAGSREYINKAVEIDRKIRALNPEPGVWTKQDGKRVKLLEAEVKDNKLILKKIQEEGKKPFYTKPHKKEH